MLPAKSQFFLPTATGPLHNPAIMLSATKVLRTLGFLILTAAFLVPGKGAEVLAAQTEAGPQELIVVLKGGQEHSFAMSQVARIEFRAVTSSPPKESVGLRPSSFSGTYRNSRGESGPDKLTIEQIQGAQVRGIWSGRPFEGTLRGRAMDFSQMRASSGCKDYKVHMEFNSDWSSVGISYSVTDRCGPSYTGTETLRRQ